MKSTLLLFIHGLGGHAKKTWGQFPDLILRDKDLRAAFHPDFYSYPTALIRIPFFGKTPKIQTLAAGLRTQINNRFTQYESIILVCHSLGGLVARYYLTEEIKQGRTPKASKLLLYAVPNNGAALASVAKYVSWRHHQISQLCKNSDFIDALNENWVREKVGEQIEVKYIVAGVDDVVDEKSAKAFWGNQNVETVVDKGHRNVVKPENSGDLAFLILKNFVLTKKQQIFHSQYRGNEETVPKKDWQQIWNVPHQRNPNFTGRAELLTDLRVALTKDKAMVSTQTQAIYGVGGVGKTQLALEYAHRFAADFQIVWWLRAEAAATLATDYAGLAAALDVPEKAVSDQAAIIKAVRHWLDHHSGWLLIFDNVVQAQDLLPYLPQAANGQVIITSRNQDWEGVASLLRVPVWRREESIKFLTQRTGEKDQVAANTLAEMMGDLPLALQLARAYIENNKISFSDYIYLHSEERKNLSIRVESAKGQGPFSEVREKLIQIRQLHSEKLLDDVVTLEGQRRLLDKLIGD